MIKIFIVDDHQMMIDGIISLLESDDHFQIVGTSKTIDEAFRKIVNAEIQFDILLTDLNLQGASGIDLVKRIKSAGYTGKSAILTMYMEKRLIKEVESLNIDGFFHKDIDQNLLKESLISIFNGAKVFPETSSFDSKYDLHLSDGKVSDNFGNAYKLSKREFQIALLVADGLSTEEISLQLELSPATVSTHRKNLHNKTNTSTPLELYKLIKG